MEHIQQIKFSDYIERNCSGLFDIVILRPEFTKVNIKEVSLQLLDNDYLPSDKLENTQYNVYGGPSLIFSEKLKSNTHLFKYADIPFGELMYHKILFCLLNINKQTIEQIYDYTLEFKWVESTHVFVEYGWLGYGIKWGFNYSDEGNPGINEGEPEERVMGKCYGPFEYTRNFRTLRIGAGMIAPSAYYEKYSDDYIETNKNIYFIEEKRIYPLLNIAHTKPSDYSIGFSDIPVDVYGQDKIVQLLKIVIPYNNPQNVNYNWVSETYKIPIQKIKLLSESNPSNKFEFDLMKSYCGRPDAISNIHLLCDNTKYCIEKILFIASTPSYKTVNNEEVYDLEFELEFDYTDYGYKVLGLSNLLVIPTICYSSYYFKVIFNTSNKFELNDIDSLYPTDFFIKLDRYAINTNPRRWLAQKYNDYLEYPIAGLIEG